jgi:hypothetical protein
MLVDEEGYGIVGKMKQFTSWFTHGVRNGSGLRKAVYESNDGREIIQRVDQFFAVSLNAVA